MAIEARLSEYKGNAMIVLAQPGKDRGVQFGVKKAKLAIENIADITTFVEEGELNHADPNEIMVLKNGPDDRYPWELKLRDAIVILEAIDAVAAFADGKPIPA